jgi:hypothetical protein
MHAMGRLSPSAAVACRALDRVRRHSEIPVVLCVDVEPDLRVVDRRDPQPWRGFERFAERMPALRDRIAAIAEAAPVITWFLRMDPQVAETWGSATWVADAYGDVLAELVGHGDELGLHTHTWRWDERAGTWFADYEDQAWADECLSMGLEAFRSTFGRSCPAHRGGDHFLCGSMLARLEREGVPVDLTIEPGWPPVGPPGGEPAVGKLPDYRAVPVRPYRSTPALFPAPSNGAGGPLLVPLFSPPALRRRHRLPLPPDSRHFVSRLAFEMLRETPPVLALVLRSDAALDCWDVVTANLEHLARHRRMPFMTASAAVDALGRRGSLPRPLRGSS